MLLLSGCATEQSVHKTEHSAKGHQEQGPTAQSLTQSEITLNHEGNDDELISTEIQDKSPSQDAKGDLSTTDFPQVESEYVSDPASESEDDATQQQSAAEYAEKEATDEGASESQPEEDRNFNWRLRWNSKDKKSKEDGID